MSDRLHHVSEFLDFFAAHPEYWETDARPVMDQHFEWPEPSARVYNRIRQLEAFAGKLEQRLPPPAAQPMAELEGLNPPQQAAAGCIHGPLLVLAGAGTGKTRTLIYRLAQMLDQGIAPERILLLTFTRRAASQMLERAQQLRPQSGATKVMGGTFHSFCAWLLRRLAPLAQLHPGFSIIDTVDAADVIDLIVQELKLRGKDKAFPRKNRIQDIISKARNLQVELAELLEAQYPELLADYLEPLELIATTYRAYKRGNHLLDFDDLLEHTRDLLQQQPAFARKARSFFDYIMVDEYQDTNRVQKELAELLSAEHRNLMVVGDEAQSIYGFRGANYENILAFPQSWPDCHIVRLEQNYRSSQQILELNNQILAHNKLSFPKTLFSEGLSGPLPQLRRCQNVEDEAIWIADKILELSATLPFKEMAVLYRAGFHGNFLQAELLKRRIPFVVYGGIRFTERRHIKDMVAYLRILQNPYDALAWHRLLQLLPGVGKVTARKILEQVRQDQGQLRPASFGKSKFQESLHSLAEVLEQAQKHSQPAAQLELLRKHYQPLLKGVESDWLNRLPDLEVLEQLAEKYEKLEKFLTDFALDPPHQQFQNEQQPQLNDPSEPPLVLSTIHSAKGLEWQAVFVMHLLDGLLPSRRCLQDFEELEEERRLLYVACSRARQQLFLSFPGFYQSFQDFFSRPSRFVCELPTTCYQFEDGDNL